MKKLLSRFRRWLIVKLGAIELEAHDKEVTALLDRIGRDYIARRKKERDYSVAVQEICRRSANSYYDWCCEQCGRVCPLRNGWCDNFDPKERGKI